MTWRDLQSDERYEVLTFYIVYYGPDKVQVLQETREKFT